MTLTETITELRRVPRSARVAQGYPVLRDFALHVMRVREQRARRRAYTDAQETIRREIAARLQRILDSRRDLRRLAREDALLDPHDSAPCIVYFAPRGPGERLVDSARHNYEVGRRYVKYHWARNGARGTVYRPSTRHVRVPAAWMIGRIREEVHHAG
jgi:hypothetical protein